MNIKKNLPNYLTYLRIAVIPALVVVFYGGNSGDGDAFYFLKAKWSYWLCAGLFLLASVTDWLDGYMARIWEAQSEIGRFLDPIADKLLVATALMLLTSEGRADYADGQAMMIPAIAIVCREILVSGLREFLACLQVSVPVSRLAKWKTGVQMGAIFLLLLGGGGPAWLHAGWFGNIALWVAAMFTLVTGYAYMKTGWKYLNAPEASS